MRTIICGALMALTIMPVHAVENNRHSANFLLPYCKGFIEGSQSIDLTWQGFCAGTIETLAFMVLCCDPLAIVLTAASKR